MGQNTSRESVSNYVNELTSRSVIRSTLDCSTKVATEQSMIVTCRVPDTTTLGNKWFEENASCQECVFLAGQATKAKLDINYALLTRGRDERPVDPTTGLPVPREAVREVDFYRQLHDDLQACTHLCKACIHDGNSQQADFSGTVECVATDDHVKAIQDDIVATIKQDMSKDSDILASVASLVTGGSDSTSITNLIEQRVTKLFTLNLLTQMKQAADSKQLMTYRGSSIVNTGNSQSSVFLSNMSVLQENGTFDSVVNASEAAVMQKAVTDVNTIKRVAFTAGNAVRQFADVLTTGTGLVAIIVAVVMFVVAVGLLMLFVSSGQTVKSFFGRGGTVRTGNLRANGQAGRLSRRPLSTAPPAAATPPWGPRPTGPTGAPPPD